MASYIQLSELAVGASATVREFRHPGAVAVRLREMGLLPGTRITLTRIAPLGDPIGLKVRGYNLTIRKSDAAGVLVEPETV